MLRKATTPEDGDRQPAKQATAARSRGRELSRRDYIPLVTPPIHTATHPKTKKRPPPCARHTTSVRRQCAAKREELFRVPLPWPLTPSHRSPAENQPAIRDLDSLFKLPVGPFVVALVPGTTRQHANEAATALQSPRRASARSLLRPLSPATAFETPDRPSQAPGTSPAAAVVPALAKAFVTWVTSLSGVTPKTPPPYVCAFRRGIVSDPPRADRFLGAERRSSPLPVGDGVLQFGIVSHATHWQALLTSDRAFRG